MTEPYDVVQQIERNPKLPPGSDERFRGYGVMSCPFSSGDILCHRRFAATSVGPAYTSIWHRDPAGAWHFYQDTAPETACPRYFGSALESVATTPIAAEWPGTRTLHISAEGFDWTLTFAATPVTRVLNTLGRTMPDFLWTNRSLLRMLGAVAGPALGAGRLRMSGTLPNNQYFITNPMLVWTITEAHAIVGGRDLGHLIKSEEQTALGDFWIPKRGLFAAGRAFFEPFDATRHLPAAPVSSFRS